MNLCTLVPETLDLDESPQMHSGGLAYGFYLLFVC